MPILFKHKKHIKTRFIPLLLLIILSGISPVLIEIVGRNIHEWKTGTPCTQQNCPTWGITWYIFITLFFSFLLLVGLGIIALIDYSLYKKKSRYLSNKKNNL